MQKHPVSWTPPFRLFNTGRHAAYSTAYRHDTSTGEPKFKRVLVKRTISGEGVLYCHGKRHVIPAGHLFVIERPGPNLYCYEGDGKPWHFEFASFLCQVSGSLLPDAAVENPILPAPDGSLFAQGLDQLLRAYLSGYGYSLETSEFAYRFYLELVRQLEGSKPLPATAVQLRKLIEENYADDLQFNSLADDFSITPEALCRSFKAAFGTTPGQYLNGVRIRHARQLLGAGELSIKEIASSCGFASANYFGRCFKRATGLTPANYRRNPSFS